MLRLDHPRVLPLLDSYVRAGGTERYLITPLMAGGSLQAHLFSTSPNKGLTDGVQRLRIALGIADGLRYLHRLRIFHRDLKPANVVCGAAGESQGSRLARARRAPLLNA